MIFICNFCNSEVGYRIFSLIGHFLNIVQICIPILLILIGVFELIKSIINMSDTSKSISKLIKKSILGILIFFIPMIVKIIFSNLNQNVANACIDCLTNPNYCSSKAEELSPLKCPDNQSFKKDINCTDETCKDREDCKKLNDEWKCCIGNL